MLPGHCSNLKELKKTKWQDWYNASKLILKEMLLKDYEKIYTGGLCIGGLISLLLSIEFNDITAIASWAPIIYLDGWTIPKYKFILPLCIIYPFVNFIYFKEKYPFGIKNDLLRNKIVSFLNNNNETYDVTPGVTIKELLKFVNFVRKNIKKVSKPIIVIHSEYDDVTSTKSADFIYKNVNSNHKKLIILKNSYHMVTIDNDKNIVFEESKNFFNLF